MYRCNANVRGQICSFSLIIFSIEEKGPTRRVYINANNAVNNDNSIIDQTNALK